MVGKIIIIKSLLASQLTYVSSILNLQEKVVKELNTLLYQFVWGGKDRVKLILDNNTVLINSRDILNAQMDYYK